MISGRREIEFEQYKYKIYKHQPFPSNHNQSKPSPLSHDKTGGGGAESGAAGGAVIKRRGYVDTRNANGPISIAANIPYPDESEIDLSCTITRPPKKRTPTDYERMLVTLESASYHLHETRKQREHLVELLHNRKDSLEFKPFRPFRGEGIDVLSVNCTKEDFSRLIHKSTEIIEAVTIESNLIRGTLLQLHRRFACSSIDAYSAMQSRVMLKEFEECIDQFMVHLKEFIEVHKFIAQFQQFGKNTNCHWQSLFNYNYVNGNQQIKRVISWTLPKL